MTATILIKRNVDKNYDRLFAAIDKGSILGRVSSLSERETATGYAVELSYLSDAVRELVQDNGADFEVA